MLDVLQMEELGHLSFFSSDIRKKYLGKEFSIGGEGGEKRFMTVFKNAQFHRVHLKLYPSYMNELRLEKAFKEICGVADISVFIFKKMDGTNSLCAILFLPNEECVKGLVGEEIEREIYLEPGNYKSRVFVSKFRDRPNNYNSRSSRSPSTGRGRGGRGFTRGGRGGTRGGRGGAVNSYSRFRDSRKRRNEETDVDGGSIRKRVRKNAITGDSPGRTINPFATSPVSNLPPTSSNLNSNTTLSNSTSNTLQDT